jgi:hypothetical protein
MSNPHQNCADYMNNPVPQAIIYISLSFTHFLPYATQSL